MTRMLARRLDRVAAQLAPHSEEPVMTIEVEFIASAKPNKIIELRPPALNWRGPWPSRPNVGGGSSSA